MQYNKWPHPIRHSEINKITLKRLIHYMALVVACFIPIHLLAKSIHIDFKFIIDNIAIAGITFFILFMIIWWLEFRLIWSKVVLIYSIHEREIPPLTAAILFEIFYQIFSMF